MRMVWREAAGTFKNVLAELEPAEGADHGYFNFSPYYEATLKRMEAFLKKIFGS